MSLTNVDEIEIKVSDTLADGNIIVGNGDNVPIGVNPSGDIDISNAGVFSINSGVIVNDDINSSANIAFSKLAAPTSNFSMNTNKITNVTDPTANQDAATKKYVDDNAGGGGTTILPAVKSADETINNDNVLSLDSDIQVSVTANKMYFVSAIILYNAGSSSDLKIKWTVPASATFSWHHDGDTGAGTVMKDETDTYSYNGAGNDRMAVPKGILIVDSTADTFGLEWAQNTSHAQDTTLLKGSCIVLTQLD